MNELSNSLLVLDDLIDRQERVVAGLKYAMRRACFSLQDRLVLRDENQCLGNYLDERSNIVQVLHSQRVMGR